MYPSASKNSYFIAIALVASCLAPAQICQAQDSFPVADMSGYVYTGMLDSAIGEAANAGAQRVSRSRDRQNIVTSPNAPVAGARLTYAPSLPRRRANYAQFVAKTRAVDPAGADNLAALFASNDVVASLGKDLQRYGLRTDNVADAYTVYWMQAWQAAHGDTSDPSRAMSQAVKAQAARAIGGTAEMASATEATKQEFAEALLIQGMMISAAVSKYKDDPAMMRQLSAAVRKGAKASGLDLDAMRLTEQGFVPSGKTGEADPAPGDALKALAAADRAPGTPAPASASPPYILIAAAGGAGLGGVFLLGKMMGKKG